MTKKVLGVVASIVMAAVGTYIVLSYVSQADARAVAGQESVEVLVVSQPIAKGTPAADIAERVELVLVPAKTQATGSVATVADLGDTIAAVDLVPGEQVLTTRFIQESELEELEAIEVPDGLLEVTVSLSPDRAVGGELVPGDLVAFVASFEPFEVGAIEPGDLLESFDAAGGDEGQTGIKTPNSSHIVLHKVLVTNVQIERLPAPGELEDAEQLSVELAPTGNLLVTLALEAPDVEKVVFTAEHGTVWLANEPADASEAGTRIETRGTIYR